MNLQLGLKEDQIIGCGEPADTGELNVLTNSYVHEGVTNNNLSEDAMMINDDTGLNTIQRMSKLRKLFKKHGHTLKFVGKIHRPEK